MVMSYDFKEVFDEADKTEVIILPTYKEPGLSLEFEAYKGIETVYKDKSPPLPFARTELFNAEISSWRRLTAEDKDCKPVYEVTFDVQGSNFEFKAGDTIGILPENRSDEVNAVLEHLGITSKADLGYSLSVNSTVRGAKVPVHIPVKSTLRHVLTHCVDLRGVLKKLFLLALSRYTKCDIERKTLEYLCSKEGSGSYTTHILNRNICLLDIFSIFKTCKPPVEVLLANLARLLPRPYSIVNSGLKNSDIIKICFSVIDLGNNRRGLTTGWLEQIISESLEKRMERLNLTSSRRTVPMYVRNNMCDFHLPKNVKSHFIMIATGTGIAPFMGFLEERKFIKRTVQSEMGEAWLFFGCKNPSLDYLYQEELEQYEDSMVLNKLLTAFSRVTEKEAKRVQNVMCRNGKEIARLIEGGASIFVCGEAKTMVAQVKECIISYLVKWGGKSQSEAEQHIAEMEKNKRYVVDLWA